LAGSAWAAVSAGLAGSAGTGAAAGAQAEISIDKIAKIETTKTNLTFISIPPGNFAT
jgi:hypothetical protein